MKRKAIMYNDEGKYFVLECGHASPLFIHKNVDVNRAFRRLVDGTLFRDCSLCQVKENKKMVESVEAE